MVRGGSADGGGGDADDVDADEQDNVDASADELIEQEGAGAGGGVSDDEAAGKKKRRKRRTAKELNLLADPTDVVVELTEAVLEELSGNRKLHQLRYPTYIVLTHPNFQLRSIEGLRAVKGTALKELDVSNNRLMVLDGLEQFATLKVIRASHNEITEVTIERLPRLKHLDLSFNRLDGLPDLAGLKALVYLDLSNNLVGSRPDSETSRDGCAAPALHRTSTAPH